MARSFHIETFGCQMNEADSGIISRILLEAGFHRSEGEEDAGVILLNTCAVRENAVEKIGNLLQHLKGAKRRRRSLLVGVLGCVPQHLREELFGRFPAVDFIAGPDTYRRLPSLIASAGCGSRPALLDFDPTETYEGVGQVRKSPVSAFIPVMRGCNNMCAFCVVPFTRGRERSQPLGMVVEEARGLAAAGYREITLLGQNVNSYSDPLSGADFPELLGAVAMAAPDLRIRFTTSHPKDISPRLVETIARNPNICRQVHLPVQSGSDRVLRLMNRGHGVEDYLEKIRIIRRALPGVSLSTDIIAGFPGESEEDHRATLELLRTVRYDSAFMFHYSSREGTLAARTLEDDVPEAVKKRRLQEIIELQQSVSLELHRELVGTEVEVLAESESRRSSFRLLGRTDEGQAVVFDRGECVPGDLVRVRVDSATSATLSGRRTGLIRAFLS
ncbi:tRNA (N6-isopentenyl adenosine(37)-C2)-methylthiotransferase MiaB [Chlorobium sp. N1]|uniref:tRNA (N6-isopentenyl adenosine(37)-C2)-methylthiotransferase MiaB n=1 Tax=Chlorobium sp. N1 TaxID=2491138 RepID=UPI0010390C4A|nr:tRNA (N6-isopentenyl adenosine(37)-C2)-methylthiotransferase MiaB [Chlorobium sp. N1]TCD47817.1 tRNA (N6-isopentenyl adenosine(37)-C2)-methylthiotransferase MiaB [Chlorobium sp. N1]